MNRSRRNKSSSRSDPPDSPSGQQTRSSRLRRSYRPSQQSQAAAPVPAESPQGRQFDFKTPTRVHRSRVAAAGGGAGGGGGFGEESPHNDSDFQHDIIWDATSPSPNRAGRRGHRQRSGLVDISEIVNRIAPKHGRPEVLEPTLQRWIGDSAAIPCTPDVQPPKARKKSPRPNGVDDLLKLARQFDLNLFQQSDGAEDQLLSQDIFSPPGGAEVQTDDLDFLFDGPTQQLSGRALSQPPTAKPAEPAEPAPPSGPAACVAFEDDWDDDDFLNDSLVMEMTQNPLQQNFASPKFSSTQKPLHPAGGVVGRTRPLAGTPGSDPNSSVRKDREEAQRNQFSPVPVGSRWTHQESHRSTQTSPTKTSSSSSCRTLQNPPVDFLDDEELLSAVWSQPVPSEPVESKPVRSEPVQSQPVWDDPADDHLLCEVCEDLENQMVAAETDVPTALPSRTCETPSASVVGGATAGAGPAAPTGPWLPQSVQRGPFTFKKPSGPVSTATGPAPAPKCSAAEIERKKQEAMERRRRRLQAAAEVTAAAT